MPSSCRPRPRDRVGFVFRVQQPRCPVSIDELLKPQMTEARAVVASQTNRLLRNATDNDAPFAIEGNVRQHDLLARMRACGAVKTGGPFKLASGAESDHYFDVKRVLLDPSGLRNASELVARTLWYHYPDVTAVGGPELGAVPLVGGVLMAAHVWFAGLGRTLPTGFMVRKAPKGYGTGNRVEGEVRTGDTPAHVAIVEDVTTSAGSVVSAIEAVSAAGGVCKVVFVVVNRGGDEARKRVEAMAAMLPVLREAIAAADSSSTWRMLMPCEKHTLKAPHAARRCAPASRGRRRSRCCRWAHPRSRRGRRRRRRPRSTRSRGHREG